MGLGFSRKLTGRPDVLPINLGIELFALHFTVSELLNLGAVLRRHLAVFILPLIDCRPCDAKLPRQRRDRFQARYANRFINRVFHEKSI